MANSSFTCASNALVFLTKVESELLPKQRMVRDTVATDWYSWSWQQEQTSESQMFQATSNVQPRPDSPKSAHSESVSLLFSVSLSRFIQL